MNQTKKDSLKEAFSNTAAAFILSLLAHKYIVSALTGEYIESGGVITDWSVALFTTLFYTALSLGRNYFVRRVWNKKVAIVKTKSFAGEQRSVALQGFKKSPGSSCTVPHQNQMPPAPEPTTPPSDTGKRGF